MTDTPPPLSVESGELLPCPNPWCGSTTRPLPAAMKREGWRVHCGCGVATHRFPTEAEAIAAWNTRPIATQSTEGLAPASVRGEAFERARDWLRKRWCQDWPNEAHCRQLADYEAHIIALSASPQSTEGLREALRIAEEALRNHACHGGPALPCLRDKWQCQAECGKAAGDALLIVEAALSSVDAPPTEREKIDQHDFKEVDDAVARVNGTPDLIRAKDIDILTRKDAIERRYEGDWIKALARIWPAIRERGDFLTPGSESHER